MSETKESKLLCLLKKAEKAIKYAPERPSMLRPVKQAIEILEQGLEENIALAGGSQNIRRQRRSETNDENFCYNVQAECDCECTHCFVTRENEIGKACAGCIVSEVRKMVDDFLEYEEEDEDDE